MNIRLYLNFNRLIRFIRIGLFLFYGCFSAIALSTPSNGIAGMAAQGISPYLANQIGEYFADQDKKGSLGHGLAHAVLGAAVAAIGGNDALTAGLTAGSAEVIAPLLSRFMYGTDNPENLTASQKKTLVSIASLAGLAAGATTGNVNDLAATNTAAVNAIENNYLTKKDVKNYIKEVRDCIQGGGSNESCRKKLDKKYELISQKRNETLTKELEACNKDIKCIGDLNQQVTELSANDINVFFGGFVNADKENLLVSLQKEGKLKVLSEVNSLREAFKQSSCSGYGSRVCAQKFDEEILQKHGITKEHLEIFDWAKRFKGKGLDSLDVLVEEGEISPAAAAALYTLITILPDSELDAVFAGLGAGSAGIGKIVSRIPKGNASILSQSQIDEILSTPKGQRPNPLEYMSKADIDAHLAKFDEGATRFVLENNLQKYGPAQVDGTAFVMPKREADELIKNAGGDMSKFAKSLGLPEEMLKNNTIVRVDINNPRALNIRIPDGNEAGVNEFWTPGGKLPNGNNEAIIDLGVFSDEFYEVKKVGK